MLRTSQLSVGVEKTWSIRLPSDCRNLLRAGHREQQPDDSDAMSAAWRPSHSLAPAHASIGYFIDASLRARGRYRAVAVIAAMIADDGAAVVAHVAPQLRAATQEISRHQLLRIGVPARHVICVMGVSSHGWWASTARAATIAVRLLGTSVERQAQPEAGGARACNARGVKPSTPKTTGRRTPSCSNRDRC